MDPNQESKATTTMPNGDPAISEGAAPNPAAAHPGVPVDHDPRSGRRLAIFAAVVAVTLIAVFTFGRVVRSRADVGLRLAAAQTATARPEVRIARVERAAPETLLTLPGEAKAFYETTVFARTSGYLHSWLVDIGDRVKEGQLLATIDTPELDDQIKESEASLASLRSEAKLAAAAADFAKISYDRWTGGSPDDGVVSQQERDQKKADLDTSLARLEVSKAKVQLGEAQLAHLKTLEGFKDVKAPFDGIVTERRVDIGALVTAGSTSSTTPLFRIAQYDQVRVFVDVPQSESGRIYAGMPLEALTSEGADRKYQGKVDRTAGCIDPMARTLRVEALVSNADHSLLPGTFVQVRFTVNRQDPPLRIPAAALTMRSAGPNAAVVGADGTVSLHHLKIDRDLGDFIEVDSGLAEGDVVALNVGPDLSDGDHVVFQQPSEKTNPVKAARADAANAVIRPTSGK